MSNNLLKRIFTSILLLSLLSASLFVNKYTWLVLILSASIISFSEFHNLIKKIWKGKDLFVNIMNLVIFSYLIFFTFASYYIYTLGLVDIIFILLVCIFSDIGGYTVGKTVGGKKLTKISPNKTISGCVGSFIFSLFPMFIFLLLYNYTKNIEYKIFDSNKMIYVSLFISLVSQCGDLIVSLFKRKAKVKDTGSILPGHGGILDRIDGILFAIPIVFIIQIILF
tara:strand:+ start:211 stop:882 length:672 start_codon:yes stop_codon:yes gene_type:complete